MFRSHKIYVQVRILVLSTSERESTCKYLLRFDNGIILPEE